MADLAFNIDQAVKELREEQERYTGYLAGTGARLEAELRAVAAMLDQRRPRMVDTPADAAHVLDIDTRNGTFGVAQTIQPGALLELVMMGRQLGSSRSMTPLPPARYRVLVHFWKIPDEPAR